MMTNGNNSTRTSPPLRGKTALVTGAARRIGRAIALALAGEGANVVVHYRGPEDEARSLCGELQARGVQAWPVPADLDDPAEAESLITRSLAAAGALDVLVNNASAFALDTLAEVTLERVIAMARTNAWAPFVLSRSFARQVGRGKIVNLLDARIAGYDFSHVSYIVSKHMLAVFTRMAALELAPDITVNAVAPGLILPPAGKDESYLQQLAGAIPLQRHGGPQDVAEAVIFLARSDFITGQVIYVDGGRHLAEYGHGSHPD